MRALVAVVCCCSPAVYRLCPSSSRRGGILIWGRGADKPGGGPAGYIIARPMIKKEFAMSPPIRIPPGPGQESVWDYPRPPRLEDTPRHIQVLFNGVVIADTCRARR